MFVLCGPAIRPCVCLEGVSLGCRRHLQVRGCRVWGFRVCPVTAGHVHCRTDSKTIWCHSTFLVPKARLIAEDL